MHGLGNDFVVINAFDGSPPDFSKKAKAICNRRFGIGCDQLLILRPSEVADFRMQIFNADGGEVEMCGNGIRCVALYARKRKLVNKDALSVDTLGGLKKIQIREEAVEVDMGEPILKGSEIPVNLEGMVINKYIDVNDHPYPITCVSMGNPHCVIFTADVEKAP